jgi:protein phosphatase 1 regulatory subunit 7
MQDFINKIESQLDTEIIKSKSRVLGKNSAVFDTLGNIRELYLYEVGLKDLKHLLPIADQLNELSLEFCSISSLELLKEFPNLVSLNLHGNLLDNSDIKNIRFLDGLRKLDIGGNRIDDTTSLGEVVSLEELCLSGSDDLTEVKGLQGLNRLSYLNLALTMIEDIKKIEVHSQIISLDLKGSEIKKISNLDRFSKIESLRLNGNPISKIEGLDNLKSLKKLNLSSLNLKKVEGLDSLVNLEILDLNNDDLFKIEGLDNLMNIKQVNLNENNISRVENLDELINLEYLLLDFNRVQEFDTSFLSKVISSHCLISMVGNPLKQIAGKIPDNIEIRFFSESEVWLPKLLC